MCLMNMYLHYAAQYGFQAYLRLYIVSSVQRDAHTMKNVGLFLLLL